MKVKLKVGTDICSVARVTRAYEKWGERFLMRILTDAEMSYVVNARHHMLERLAGRFAAKEATVKVLGTGWHGVGWKEVEIVRLSSGEPTLRLSGRALDVARRRQLTDFEVSISHEREFAVAFVVGYSNQE